VKGREKLFDRGGDMAARMTAFDWGATPLGVPDAWPQSLRTAVRIMLTSRYAMWMAWGEDLTFFCNDAYLPTLGVKGSWALGSPARKVWEEIWPEVGPRIEHVLTRGEATWDEGLLLFLYRSGYSEETYHTFSYSPLFDDSGRATGMLCVVTEETVRVLSERRMAVLRDLAAGLAGCNHAAELFQTTERTLSKAQRDFPFALAYLLDEGSSVAQLVLSSGITAGTEIAPHTIDTRSANGSWPIGRVLEEGDALVLENLEKRYADLPTGPWLKPPEKAILLPLIQPGSKTPAGVFIAGINPFRPFDDIYRSFAVLFAGQLTAAIGNVRAYQAERRRAEALAELDRAKTTFFSNVSHEFRTPLTLMLGPLLETLSEHNGSLSHRVAEELTVVHRNGLRLLKLVNTLLDFSRIEAGRVQASFVPTDLPAFTSELASAFRSATEKAGLALTIDTPALAELAYVDRDMWEKIVLNLISNAFKFTLSGGITVRIREASGSIQLSVQDTGTGIPQKEIPRLFERFHRVEGARGRSIEGSGIGLALVQELVKIHHGRVAVESEMGKGSTFTVQIPVGKAHLPLDHIGAERVRASTAVGVNAYIEEALRWLPDQPGVDSLPSESISLGERFQIPTPELGARSYERPCVLIADDNADMRAYIRRLLDDRYEVITTRDGHEALVAARSRKPALILSDVMMPNLDGFGLLNAIRGDAQLRKIPLILLSARAGEEATLDGIRAGASDYLIKPFSARELVARVDAQIERDHFERELAQATVALQQTEERLAFSVEAAELGTFYCPMPLGKLVWNKQCKAHFWLPPDAEVDIELFYSILHEEDRTRIRMMLDRALLYGEPFDAEYRTVGPDGRQRWVRAKGRAYFDSDGKPTRLDGVTLDISKLKTTEQLREQTLVAERVAREEAERVSHMKDEFLATLSHELRTPLNAIVGWSQILSQQQILSEPVRQGLEVIERNAKAQTQIIEDLLDMSRIISGRIRLDVQRVSIADVVTAAIQSVQPSADVKGVRLRTVLDPYAGPVAGDVNRLQQVVWNLLTNAIKFTPRGGQVQVLLERVNSHLEISVSDTGEGIAPEFLPYLFERFRLADASTTRRHGGLGLGLSIVKQLVELHGGTVRAKSPGLGQGSTFTVTLPVSIIKQTQGGSPSGIRSRSSSVSVPAVELPSLAGITILVVDDDADARQIMERILRDGGASVVTASSAGEALAILPQLQPNLLVSDIGMPGEDGYDLIKKVRALPRNAGGAIPAVALTAFVRSEDRQLVLRSGYQMHVAKPVEPSELLTVCASLVGRIS
jgi:signal transduction histidine kinase